MFYGSASGLTTTGSRLISYNTSGVPGAAETGDDFSSAVRLADVTGDGRAELAIGSPNENSYGAVWLLRGNSSGISTSGVLSVSARDVGVTTSGQGWFGIALATTGEQPRTPA
ncbi:FG-GAP repeat protein [Streptomyces bullii]|uniref:FG-GAP repeat protein n=1 Tax=Streptomyces bullii TaxID=349910 RepID=A0ABW0V0F2_9ACTN